MRQSGGLSLAAGLDGGNTIIKSSPVARTISSVHNGLKLWTLDFYVLMYEQAVCLLIQCVKEPGNNRNHSRGAQ